MKLPGSGAEWLLNRLRQAGELASQAPLGEVVIVPGVHAGEPGDDPDGDPVTVTPRIRA